MREIENDVPEVLVELAREAFSLGLAKVRLGFMYMDGDFRSPIEWALWLVKRERGGHEERNYLSPVIVSRGEENPTSYVASTDGNWENSRYMELEEIQDWLREPLRASGEYTPAWAPVENPALQKRLLDQWSLFEMGVRSGWVMERAVSWDDELSFDRIRKLTGESKPADYLPNLKLGWDATNSFYNLDGHPSHRDTGAELTVGGWSLLTHGREEEFYRNSGSHPASMTREQVTALLENTAPWFIRVAKFDEEKDEWLHYPEALQPFDETIEM